MQRTRSVIFLSLGLLTLGSFSHNYAGREFWLALEEAAPTRGQVVAGGLLGMLALAHSAGGEPTADFKTQLCDGFNCAPEGSPWYELAVNYFDGNSTYAQEQCNPVSEGGLIAWLFGG